jgi:hypothetical protein
MTEGKIVRVVSDFHLQLFLFVHAFAQCTWLMQNVQVCIAVTGPSWLHSLSIPE